MQTLVSKWQPIAKGTIRRARRRAEQSRKNKCRTENCNLHKVVIFASTAPIEFVCMRFLCSRVARTSALVANIRKSFKLFSPIHYSAGYSICAGKTLDSNYLPILSAPVLLQSGTVRRCAWFWNERRREKWSSINTANILLSLWIRKLGAIRSRFAAFGTDPRIRPDRWPLSICLIHFTPSRHTNELNRIVIAPRRARAIQNVCPEMRQRSRLAVARNAFKPFESEIIAPSEKEEQTSVPFYIINNFKHNRFTFAEFIECTHFN